MIQFVQENHDMRSNRRSHRSATAQFQQDQRLLPIEQKITDNSVLVPEQISRTVSHNLSRTQSSINPAGKLDLSRFIVSEDKEEPHFIPFTPANEEPIQLIPFQQRQVIKPQLTSSRQSSSSAITVQDKSKLNVEDFIQQQEKMLKQKNEEVLQRQRALIGDDQKSPTFQMQKPLRTPITPQQPLINRQNPPAQPNSRQQEFPYFNFQTFSKQWNIIWDVDKLTTVPLILDKADTYCYFPDLQAKKHDDSKITEWTSIDSLESSIFYSPLSVSNQNNMTLNIQHSNPADNLTLIEPNLQDFEHFHHPIFNGAEWVGRPIRVNYHVDPVIDDPDFKPSPFLKKLNELSGIHGKILVLEHISKDPPFITNVGMCSRLLIYWHKEKENDKPKTLEENMIIYQPTQDSPFLAKIPKNTEVPAIVNNLFRAPVCEQKVKTDFLLIRPQFEKLGTRKFYIRKIDGIYATNKLEPLDTVLSPNTKATKKFISNFIKAIIINLFRGNDQFPGRRRIQVSTLNAEYFPQQGDPKLRRVLKKIAFTQRDKGKGFWERSEKGLDQEFQKLEMSPEQVCKYQSMLWGQWKLVQAGVNIITSVHKVNQKINNLKGERMKAVAQKIELELLKTPWARTHTFHRACEGRALQIVSGADGDTFRDKSRRQKAGPGEEKPKVYKNKLAGTNKDLRKIPNVELNKLLQEQGVKQEQIISMNRWKKVSLVRDFANRVDPQSSIASLYARGPRNEYRFFVDSFKTQYQAQFDTNLQYLNGETDQGVGDEAIDELSSKIMQFSDDQSEDEDNFDDEENDQNDNPQQAKKNLQIDTNDPPELVPNGIATSPTKINWNELGFEGTLRRPVAKVITVMQSEDGPQVSVKWIRATNQIKALQMKPNVYQTNSMSESNVTNDLERDVLKSRKSALQEKIRHSRQKKPKGSDSEISMFIPFMHDFLLVTDSSGGELVFNITPEVLQIIKEASDRYSHFSMIHGHTTRLGGIGKRRSRQFDNDESESEDGDEEVIRKQTVHRNTPEQDFNEALKAIIDPLQNNPEYSVFVEPVQKSGNQQYFSVIKNPICIKDILGKIDRWEYYSVESFKDDVNLLISNSIYFNKGRDANIYELTLHFEKDFGRLMDERRLAKLVELQDKIDPALKKANKKK